MLNNNAVIYQNIYYAAELANEHIDDVLVRAGFDTSAKERFHKEEELPIDELERIAGVLDVDVYALEHDISIQS